MGYNYITIIPLIGGMTLGNIKATKVKPKCLLSYSIFSNNDNHLVKYLKNVPYYLLDEKKYSFKEKIDFVSSVCPCAGLSMLNSSKDNGEKSRGEEAIQNQWMYKTASYVLSTIKPRVMFGENAPNLFTDAGKAVREKLQRIGKANGYTFLVIKTSTLNHGVPQNRVRTFYFFFEGNKIPKPKQIKKHYTKLDEFLSVKNYSSLKHFDDFIVKDTLKENGYYLYALKELGKNYREIILEGKNTNSILAYCVKKKNLSTLKKYLNDNELRRFKRILSKLDDGLGYWNPSPIIVSDYTNAIIGKNCRIIHPIEERYLSVRDTMILMSLPNDFKLQSEDFHHVFQNVPVNTAADYTNFVLDFLNNKIELLDESYLLYNNINDTLKKGE